MQGRRGAGLFARRLALAAAAGLAIAGCGTVDRALPSSLQGMATRDVQLGSQRLELLVADTPAERARGLSGISLSAIAPLDGMLFAYPEPSEVRFHMRDVPAPLDIAFVGADGRVVSVQTMDVCDAEPCPTYGPGRHVQWAVEAAAGRLAAVLPGDVLRLDRPPAGYPGG